MYGQGRVKKAGQEDVEKGNGKLEEYKNERKQKIWGNKAQQSILIKPQNVINDY